MHIILTTIIREDFSPEELALEPEFLEKDKSRATKRRNDIRKKNKRHRIEADIMDSAKLKKYENSSNKGDFKKLQAKRKTEKAHQLSIKDKKSLERLQSD